MLFRSKSFLTNRAIPATGAVVGSALSAWDAANETRAKLAAGRGLSAPDAKKYAKLAEAFQLRNYARRAWSMRQGAECRRFMWQAMKADMRMFWYEPVMSGVTLAAVALSPIIPGMK